MGAVSLVTLGFGLMLVAMVLLVAIMWSRFMVWRMPTGPFSKSFLWLLRALVTLLLFVGIELVAVLCV